MLDDQDELGTGVLPDTLDEITEALTKLRGVSIGGGTTPLEQMHPWAIRRLNRRLRRAAKKKIGRPKLHWKTRQKRKRERDRKIKQRQRERAKMTDAGMYRTYCEWWKGRKYEIELTLEEFVEIFQGINCKPEIRLYPGGVVRWDTIWIVDRDDPRNVVYDGQEAKLRSLGYIV